MFSIFRKEINGFFSSLIGYIAIGVFLLLLSLFLWVFPAYNIMDYGYATLESLFNIAPMVMLILIPAITMRSFAEEKKEGTIELLETKPLSEMDIILGKYLASLFLVSFSILPTLVYFYSVWQLGNPHGNLDIGGTIGSYIGLMFLGAAFVAIGLFCSALANDQIVAFIAAAALSAFAYLGFFYLSELPMFVGTLDSWIDSMGMRAHFDSLSRGLIDTRDLLYFLSLVAAFLLLTQTALERRKWR